MKRLLLLISVPLLVLATWFETAGGQSRPLEPLLVVRLEDPSGLPAPQGQGRGQQPAPRVPLAPLPVTRLDEPGASATLDAVRPLSLRFAEPLPVRDVLLLLVRDTGLSLVTEPGVDATFIGELHDVSLRQALDLVLLPHGLRYAVEGTAIRVFRRRPETRVFDVNINLAARAGEGRIAASTTPAGDDASGSRASVRWETAEDAFDALGAAIRSQLSPEGRFSLDRRAGVAQVTDDPERLDRIATYIEMVERRLNRQVEIQARVVEVTLNDPSAVAVDWAAALDRGRTRSALGTTGLDFAAFVSALGEQGTVSILATPRVQALHNEPALMRIGVQDVVFVRERDGLEAGDRPRAAAILDGFTLAVTPHISADGAVVMSVSPSVTQRTGETRSQDRQRVPVMAVDELSTAVRLRDGETLLLPGLRRDRERQAPGAGRGLSGLFRREPAQKTYSELAVLLTPRVL